MPERLGAGRWQHALFTTYTIDLEFFEHQVWSPLPETCRNVVVLADEERFLDACQREAPRRLVSHLNRRYVVDGLRFPGAAHAKVVLLTNEEQGRLLVGSGNLGPKGWVRGGEVFTEYDYDGKDASALPPFLAVRDLLSGLLEQERVVGITRERVEMLLSETPWLYGAGSAQRPPVRHNLTQTFLDQLVEVVDNRPVAELRVLSPFYDPAATALSALLDALQPAVADIYVEPKCTSVDPDRLVEIRDARGAECRVLPFKREGCDYVHAKAYLAKMDHGDVLLTGSPNLSRAAMLNLASGANLEVASLLEGVRGEFDYLFDELLAAPPQADLSPLGLELADSSDGDGGEPALVLVRVVLLGKVIELHVRGLLELDGLRLRIGEEVHTLDVGAAAGDTVVTATLSEEVREKLAHCVPVAVITVRGGADLESNPVFVMDRAALAAEARAPQSRAVTSAFADIPLDDELAEIVMPLEIALGDIRGAWRPAAKAANPALSADDEELFVQYDSVDLEVVRQHPKIQQYLHSHGVHSFADDGTQTVLDSVPLSVAEFFRHFAQSERTAQPWQEPVIVVGEDDGSVTEEEAEKIQAENLDLAQRRLLAVKRFVATCVKGITSEGFCEITGYGLVTRVYAIFDHILLRLAERRWVELNFLADAAASIWEFYWGTAESEGFFDSGSDEERKLALEILEAHEEPKNLLAMLSAVSLARTDPPRPKPMSAGEENEGEQLVLVDDDAWKRARDVLRGQLLRQPLRVDGSCVHAAVELSSRLSAHGHVLPSTVLTSLEDTERHGSLLEFRALLEQLLGPGAKGAGFEVGVQCRRPAIKQDWAAKCLVFISEDAIKTTAKAELALRAWMRWEPKLIYYRVVYPPDGAAVQVAFYDRVDDSGAYRNARSLPGGAKLGYLAPWEPLWQDGLERLRAVFIGVEEL